MQTPPITFTRAGVWRGYTAMMPISLGVAVFGVVFGLAAGENGLSLVETGLMSALVFAGASQMLAMTLWADPVPIGTLAFAALVINLRYLIMTAALKPWLAPLPAPLAYGTLFFAADENWALSMAAMSRGGRDAGFFLGTGLSLYSVWLAASLLGRVAGSWVPNPEALGVDVVGIAVFLFLLVDMWKGPGDILPWAVAGAAAIAASVALPGTWYLLIGGLAGSLAGAWRDVRRSDDARPVG
ncbi:AzlC family ABC transporter permease [Zavarzinia sp. CC-PAN008]|uniref:AzlC family ABC transporter permease n=1 Tax=Zavarzinia sp. CC-PAN008 TaxID=3243332 RepID=UPI003F747343